MRRPFLTATSLLWILFLLSACEQTAPVEETVAEGGKPAPAEACVLHMGWDPWEPYQFRNARGEVTGLDVEIAVAVAEQAGCGIEFVEGQWMDLLEQLRSGDVHFLAGATPTPGREAFATFTPPYRSEAFVVYARAGDETVREITALDELVERGTTLGTVAEYYYGPEISPVLDALFDAGRLREAVVAELNYERVLSREIDAFIEDPFVATAILRNRGLGNQIVPTGILIEAKDVSFMLSQAGMSEEHAVGFTEALDQLRASGRLEQLLSRYRAADQR